MSSNYNLTINRFLEILQREGEAGPAVSDSVSFIVERYRQSCHACKYDLRGLFATSPGNPIVQNPYYGVFDIFDVAPEVLLARPRDYNEPITNQFTLDHEDKTYYFPLEYLMPIPPHLQRVPGTWCIVDDLSAFRRAWDIFSGGALSAVKNWDNIIIAGGSVLACLTSFPSNPNPSQEELFKIYQSCRYKRSDIDLFLWGMNEDQVLIIVYDPCLASNRYILFCPSLGTRKDARDLRSN